MPDFNAWAASDKTIGTMSAADLATRAWSRIQHRPTSVVISRNGSNLAAQVVRVEISNGGSELGLAIGEVAKEGVVIYGIQDHPTEPDTNLARGDRFALDGKIHQITVVVTPRGEIQAFGEVSS